MNDPNGFAQWNGQYHLFYQHNPSGAFHGNIHWGHTVSEDLVHWQHLPIALSPDPDGPDEDGCWSGCFVDDNGVPTMLYTAVSPEVQCVAIGSEDMIRWQKLPENPIIAAPPSNMNLTAFRDPCVWRENDAWCMALGAGIKGRGGAVLLYKSTDLRAWNYIGPLLMDDGQSPGKVWECPAFFPLGDMHVLVVSVTSRAYVDYFIGQYDGERFDPDVRRRLDYGRYFYAPQTLLDDKNRRIMIGWIGEGRSEDQDIDAGWSGIQSIPRALNLQDDNYIGVKPIDEIQMLRGECVHFDNLILSDGVPYRSQVKANQLEILLTCHVNEINEVGVIIAQSPDGKEYTKIVFNQRSGELYVDRRHSNLRGDVNLDTQYATLCLRDSEPLKLHIFFDRSVIEIFANDRVCLTTRVYPTRADSQGLSFFVIGADTQLDSLDIWKISDIWK